MTMRLTDIAEIRELLARHGFRFSKSLGQNFLVADWVPRDIADSAGLDADTGVLEIGPGIGTMTQYLAENARQVVAVEIDRNLIPILGETLAAWDNVTIINEDILKVDIRELAEYFIGQFSNKYTRGIRSIREDALTLLESMPFPGNVRELANLAERAVVLCQSADLCAEDIRSALVGGLKTPPESPAVSACLPRLREADRLLSLPAEEQRRRITHAFEEAGGSQQLAAEILGVSRTTLWRKRKELGL